MARNGSPTAFNVSAAFGQLNAKVQRAVEIQNQINSLTAELQQVLSGDVAAPTLKRRGRPAASTVSKRRGRKPAASTSAKAPKTRRPRGNSLVSVLAQVLPSNEETAINKDEIVTRVQSFGYESNSKSLKIGIGQALGNGKKEKLFLNSARGLWQLSAAGVKSRDKAKVSASQAEPIPVNPTPTAADAVASPAGVA